ncbi:MAG: hypothetical protein QW303_01460 [Nitrososphaerota archaeon]
MSRSIRRLRRNNDLYSSPNIPSEGRIEAEDYPTKGVPKNKCSASNIIQPTLAQRIVYLENEVSNINATFAKYTNELNKCENRLAPLEKLIIEIASSPHFPSGKCNRTISGQSCSPDLCNRYSEKMKSHICTDLNPRPSPASEEKKDDFSSEEFEKISSQNNINLTLKSCSPYKQNCPNSKNSPKKLETYNVSNFNVKECLCNKRFFPDHEENYRHDKMRMEQDYAKIREKLQKNKSRENLSEEIDHDDHEVSPEKIESRIDSNFNAKLLSRNDNDFHLGAQDQLSGSETLNTKVCEETVETIRIPKGTISVEKDVTLINQVPGINRNTKVLWTTRIAGTNADQGSNIAIDMDNNIIVGGFYVGEEGSQPIIPSIITFYHSDGTEGKLITSFSGTSLFIVKYDPFGVVLWIAKIINVASDNGFGITTNGNDDIIVTGSYRKQIEIYDSNNQLVSTLPVDGILNTFVVKYDCSGNVAWNLNITAPNDGTVEGLSVASDTNSNIYITGYYKGSSIEFRHANKLVGATISGRNGEDAFLVKYDSNGFFQWISQIIGTDRGQERGLDVATGPKNEVVVTGFYTSNQINIFNGSPNEPTLATSLTNFRNSLSPGEQDFSEIPTADAFVVKYDGVTGKVFWTTNISGPKTEKGNGVSIDRLGNIVVTGSYSSDPAFVHNASDSTQKHILKNGGMEDAFIAKYDPNGNVLWTARIAGGGQEQGIGVATDLNNNVVVTGQYSSNLITIYGANDYTGPKLSNATGSTNAFIIKYDPDGGPIWAGKIENIGIGSGLRVAFDGDNNIVSTGFYNNNPLNIYNSDGSIGGILKNPGKLLPQNNNNLTLKLESLGDSKFSIGSNIFVVKYIEYLQCLTLPPALCTTKTKRITLNSYGGSNTLISVFQNGMVDGADRNVCALLLTNIGSSVMLVWENNKWNIAYFREVVPIYS